MRCSATTVCATLSATVGTVASYCSLCCSCCGLRGDFYGAGGSLEAFGLDLAGPRDADPAVVGAFGLQGAAADPVVDLAGGHVQAGGGVLDTDLALPGLLGGQ